MSVDKKITWPGWETVQLIGRGSFGAVYEIQRDVFGDIEKAALKVITIPQNSSDIEEMYGDGYDEESITNTFQSHLRSIVAEYSLMRKMNGCTNIVNCDDVRYVQHDDGIGWDIFIKMELLTPLPKALPMEITEELVLKIAKDMCCALELCKKYEIVHRDIKPQNIFVSSNGDYKLGDFGIAKTVEKTMGGTKIGTYKYMAPEVYNNEPYGSGADIYSLGLVLYWLLNERRMPFLPLPPEKLKAGMDEAARNRRLSGESIPAPAHGNEGLKQIVLKACAYDVKERYVSVSDMLADLNRLGGMVAQESGSQVPVNVVNGSVTNTEQINIETAKEEQTIGVLEVIENSKQEVRSDVVAEEMTVGLFGGENSAAMKTKQEREEEGTIGLFGSVKVAEEENIVVPKEVERVQKKENSDTVQKQAVSAENTDKGIAVETKKEIPWSPMKFEEEQEETADVSVKKEFPKKLLWGIGGGLVTLMVVLVCVFGGMNRGDSETTNLVQNSGASVTEVPVETNAPVETMTMIATKAPTEAPTVAPAATPAPTLAPIVAIDSDYAVCVALRADGTVVADGSAYMKEYDVSKWRDVVSISTFSQHIVGLKKDGTVVAVGENNWGQCNVSDWTNIVEIVAGEDFTAGLRADGTVTITGKFFCDEILELTNIKYIMTDGLQVVCVDTKGNCISCTWAYTDERCTDIVEYVDVRGSSECTMFCVMFNIIVGIDSSGNASFIYKPNNDMYDINISEWKNVVKTASGLNHMLGVRSDGTVVASGWNDFGQCNVSDWTDIIAVSAGSDHSIGLKSDGTIVVAGEARFVSQLNMK